MSSNAALGESSGPRTLLDVGSGPSALSQWAEQGYTVIRLDIEPKNEPDICASMTNMGDIGPYDAVWCCHALEHLYPHDVSRALAEFYRVLKPGGKAIVMVPDLEDVRPTEDALPDMGLSGLYLYYGDATQIERAPYMAHHCGFVSSTLRDAFLRAGFDAQTTRIAGYNLLCVGTKP